MLYISNVLLHKNTVRVLGCFSEFKETHLWSKTAHLQISVNVHKKKYTLNSNTKLKKNSHTLENTFPRDESFIADGSEMEEAASCYC